METKSMVDALGTDFPKSSLGNTSARISMPLKEVFETGINCAIFGDAGAGKSTTLFNYAAIASNSGNEQDIALFLPLTRVLSEIISAGDDINRSPLMKLEAGIVSFLRLSKAASISEVISFLKGKRRVTFIFDGVDEVIKSAPWVIGAIADLEKDYENSQILLSSRTSGSYVGAIKYLGLTLLPFTDDQVCSFVDGWFKDSPAKAKNVKDHLLATPVLAEIVRNPLLATILCVLAGNEVPLPAGELSMYDERLKLLLGHYDIHKKTRRVTSHHSLLELTARRLAYHLHNKNLRFASLEFLESAAVSLLAKSFAGATEQQVRVAVRELIDPCNILEPMTEDGEFGFGHLRYQEHLCASELRQNRGIDLLPLLASSWWRSVLVLFTRMTDDVSHIIGDVIEKQSDISRIKENLMAMIATRPTLERKQLTRLVEQHEKLDEESRNLKEYFDFDNEIDDGDRSWA